MRDSYGSIMNTSAGAIRIEVGRDERSGRTSVEVILTALTRIGSGSKVVLCWDVAQRDNLRVGRHDGVHAVVDKLHGQDLFAHVTLTKSERSPVAYMVARLLDDLTA